MCLQKKRNELIRKDEREAGQKEEKKRYRGGMERRWNDTHK